MPPRRFGVPNNWRYDPSSNSYSVSGYFPEYETVVRGKRPRHFPRDRMSLSDKTMMHYQNRGYGQKILNSHRTDLYASANPGLRIQHNLSGSRGGYRSGGIDWLKVIRRGRSLDRGRLVKYTGPGMVGAIPGNTSTFGKKILSNLSSWKKKQFKLTPPARTTGGSCWRVTVDRMKQGYQGTYKKKMFQGASKEKKMVFESIAGSRSGVDPWTGHNWAIEWKKIPKSLRWKGVPGALAYMGLAEVVEGADVWKGKISPGSPLQLWYGIGRLGHSCVMNRYIYNRKGKIVGLVYSDQWLDYKVVMKSGNQKVIGARFLK